MLLLCLFFFSLSVCEQVFCCETGQPQSVSLAAILIYRACGAFSLRGSTRVCGEQQALRQRDLADELFPRYHVGASTRELDVIDAAFWRNLI